MYLGLGNVVGLGVGVPWDAEVRSLVGVVRIVAVVVVEVCCWSG